MFGEEMTYRNKKILAAAKGEECTANIPGVCNFNHETTVAAHSPFKSMDGGGMAHKPPDYAIAFLCSSCHDLIDGRTLAHSRDYDRELIFRRAHMKTIGRLFELGKIN